MEFRVTTSAPSYTRAPAVGKRDGADRFSVPRHVAWGAVVLDRWARMIVVAGTPVRLTATEYHLVELLVLHRSQTVSREELSETVLGRPFEYGKRAVDQLVTSIRNKIVAACGVGFGRQALIGAHRCQGYFLRGGA